MGNTQNVSISSLQLLSNSKVPPCVALLSLASNWPMFILVGAMCFHKIVKTANSRVIYSHNLFSFPDIPFIF